MCLSQLKLQWMLRKHLCPTEWYNGCCFMLTFHLFAMFKHSPKCAHAVQSSSWTWFHSTACICMVCGVRQVLLGKLLTPDTCVAVESGQIRTTKERISYRFAYCTFLTFWAFCTSARFSPFQLCYKEGLPQNTEINMDCFHNNVISGGIANCLWQLVIGNKQWC